MLLIVAATPQELRGAPVSADVRALACGVGPVDAAIRVAVALATSDGPDAAAGAPIDGTGTTLLHVGISGARRASGIVPGTVVIGSRADYCDTRSSLVARELRPVPELLERARAALPDAVVAPIGTSADVGGSHGCDVEAMEGYGVLRAAGLAGVPALEVRVVSNEMEEPDRDRWQFGLALDRLADVLPTLAESLSGYHQP